MASTQQLVPCPLGNNCPGGGRHYSDSAVYRDHQRLSNGKVSNNPDEGFDEKRNRQYNPLDDVSQESSPKKKSTKKDNPENPYQKYEERANLAAGAVGYMAARDQYRDPKDREKRDKDGNKKKDRKNNIIFRDETENLLDGYEKNSTFMKLMSRFFGAASKIYR